MGRLGQHLRTSWWLHLTGIVSTITYTFLSLGSQQIEPISLTFFFLSWGVVWAALLNVFLWSQKKKLQISLIVVVLWAALFRIAGIAAVPMLSEDDYFRFLWDGYRFAETGDPYQDIPADFFDDSEVSEPMSEIVYDINYPHLPTIYGPVMEVVFLASYKIAPGNLIVLKIFFVLFEGFFLLLLSRFLNSRWFLFAAWCPLLVLENSFQAHPDLIGISLMTWAFLASKKGQPWIAMLALGLASSAKIFAILLWPFIVKKECWFRQGVLMATVIVAAYWPFISLSQDGSAGSISLQAMATGWEFNAAGYALLKLVSSEAYARPLTLAIFALIYLILLFKFWQANFKGVTKQPPLDLVFGAFFFLSPVINPWYLLWLLPFAFANPRSWSLIALCVVSLSYATGLNLESQNLNDFEIPLWVKLIEFSLIAFAILIDRKNIRRRSEKLTELNEEI